MTARFRLTLLLLTFLLAGTTAEAQQKPETITNPRGGTPEATVAAALKAGVAGDFNAYMATVHPEHKEKLRQVNERRKYEWKRFKKQAAWYVKKRKPLTFQVTSRRPEGKTYYRIFIKDQRPDHANRMPVPVRLKKSGTAWKIVTSSL